MLPNLLILLVLLLLSAFFSATEVAFVSLTEAKVITMVRRRLPRAKLVKKLKDRPRKLLITILIGNNVVNIAAASLATIVAAQIFASAVLGITTGVMTFLVLVFGEIMPKSYAAGHAKKLAIFAAPVLYSLQIIAWPAVILLEWLTNIFAGKQRTEKVSEQELKAMAMVGRRQGTIEKDEAAILNRLFKMNDLEAEDIMTPRKEINFLQDDISIEKAAEIISQLPHTRFPIIHKSADKIAGLVHSRDVLLAFNEDKEGRTIKKIIRPIIKINKDIKLDDLLREFQKKQTHMAVVRDKKGKTRGIVTLEDVIEELVGEIIDETDVEMEK